MVMFPLSSTSRGFGDVVARRTADTNTTAERDTRTDHGVGDARAGHARPRPPADGPDGEMCAIGGYGWPAGQRYRECI